MDASFPIHAPSSKTNGTPVFKLTACGIPQMAGEKREE